MPSGDLNGDGVVDQADWKLAFARWWFYIALIMGIVLALLVFPWWVTITILFSVVLFAAASKWALGRWFP